MSSRKKQNLWPLALVGVFSLFIGAVLVILVLSRYNTIDLVSSDYYEQGIEYQQQIERFNRVRQDSLELKFEYNRTERKLNIHFPPDLDINSTRGTIVLFRPADAGQDKKIPLMIGSDHRQTINMQKLVKGLWRIKIFWQKERTEFYQEETVILN